MEQKNAKQQNDLMELYKVADENHRFYVSKRFTIISFYFPLITFVLSGIYAFAGAIGQILICLLGVVLTLFLYGIERRNWILSNICLKKSKEIGIQIESQINRNDNLHEELDDSYNKPLPVGSTWLDSIRIIKRIATSQHKAVYILTFFLFIYWIILALLAIILYSLDLAPLV